MIEIVKQSVSAKSDGHYLYPLKQQHKWFDWIAEYNRIASIDPPLTRKDLFSALLPVDVETTSNSTAAPILSMKIKTRVLVPCFVIRPDRYVIVRPPKNRGQSFWMAKVTMTLKFVYIYE